MKWDLLDKRLTKYCEFVFFGEQWNSFFGQGNQYEGHDGRGNQNVTSNIGRGNANPTNVFLRTYQCYSPAFIGKPEINRGNKSKFTLYEDCVP